MIDATDDIGTRPVIETNEWRWVFIASTLLVLMVSLPFMLAYTGGGAGKEFMGVLVNPQDGMTYLAKMMEGYNGSWLFRLPYTPEPQPRGVFLYTFYISLGHLARLLNLQPIQVMNAVRLIGSLLMLVAIYQFISNWTQDVGQRRVTWGLAVVASGLAWILVPFGHHSPDLLILPEAFPLQAAYTNAHFPWAIAAAVWVSHCLVTAAVIERSRMPALDAHTVSLVAATLVMASISPFILVPVGIGYGALCIYLWVTNHEFPRTAVIWGGLVVLFSLPLLLYGIWAISPANPVFNQWMSQNQTPSPPPWDYLAAFGPLLLLGGIGLWGARRHLAAEHYFLIGWIASTFILAYLPFGLQRRFMMGITIPLAIFAGIGLWRVLFPLVGDRWQRMLVIVVLSLTAPTTVIAIALPLWGVQKAADTHSYYSTTAEVEAMQWLQTHASPTDALVLASPDVGLFLPTYGLRVVYGHPFETLRAEQRQQEVISFFDGTDCSVAATEAVQYIFVGPSEKRITDGGPMCPLPEKVVYEAPGGEVVIYAAGQ